MNLEKTVLSDTFKGLGWMSLAKLISQFFSWLVTFYIARILSPSDYGLMGMASILIAFFYLFNDFGLGQAIIQRDDLDEEALSVAFWLILGVSVFLFVMTLFLAPVAANFFHNEALKRLISVLGINFILGALRSIPNNLLAKELRFAQKARIEMFASLINSAFSLLFASQGMGVWTLVLAAVINQFLTTVFTYIYYPWQPKFSFALNKIKPLLNFGGKITSTSLLWYLYSNSDTIIIGRLLGERLTGIYNMAFELAHLPVQKVTTALNQVFYPVLSRLKNNQVEFSQYFFTMTKLMANVAMPVFVFMAVNARSIITLILTEKWLEMILPFQILCLVGCLRSVMVMIPHALNARNHPEKNLISTLLGVIFLPVGFYLGSFYGIKGVAMAWVAIYPWCALYLVWAIARLLDLSLWEFGVQFRAQFFLALLEIIAQILFSHWFWAHFSSPILFLGCQAMVALFIFLIVIHHLYPGLISNPVHYFRKATANI